MISARNDISLSAWVGASVIYGLTGGAKRRPSALPQPDAAGTLVMSARGMLDLHGRHTRQDGPRMP